MLEKQAEGPWIKLPYSDGWQSDFYAIVGCVDPSGIVIEAGGFILELLDNGKLLVEPHKSQFPIHVWKVEDWAKLRECYFESVRKEQQEAGGKRKAASPTGNEKKQKVDDERYIFDLAAQLSSVFERMIVMGADADTILAGLQARANDILSAQEPKNDAFSEDFEVKSEDGRRAQTNGAAGTWKDRKPLREAVPALGAPIDSNNDGEEGDGKENALKAQRALRADLRKKKKLGSGGETHAEDMALMETADQEIEKELQELEKVEGKKKPGAGAKAKAKGKGKVTVLRRKKTKGPEEVVEDVKAKGSTTEAVKESPKPAEEPEAGGEPKSKAQLSCFESLLQRFAKPADRTAEVSISISFRVRSFLCCQDNRAKYIAQLKELSLKENLFYLPEEPVLSNQMRGP